MPTLPPSPVFGVDVDGVLADLVGPLLDQVFAATTLRFHPHDIVRFDLAGILGPHGWAAAHDALTRSGFARHLPILPGALQGITALRTLGRVVFVTTPFAPSPTWAHDRAAWLAEHFEAQPADLVSLADKTLFRGELLIDDSPTHLEAWSRLGRLAIRVDRPWNSGAAGVPARSWEEVVRIVTDHLSHGREHASAAVG